MSIRDFLLIGIAAILTCVAQGAPGQEKFDAPSIRLSDAAQKTPALPEFEVASVKPSRSDVVGLFVYPGGRVVASACPLRYLLMEAFRIQKFQVKGGPHWIDEARFDIEAKPPASSASVRFKPSTAKLSLTDEQCQMLQALLISRFQLKYHVESGEGKIFVLMTGSKTSMLKAANDKDEFPWAGFSDGPEGELRGINITISELTARISDWVGRPVLDKTGLHGSFDFDYKLDEGDSSSNADRISSVITCLTALGLRLKENTGPVEILVIDHVEKPSEN